MFCEFVTSFKSLHSWEFLFILCDQIRSRWTCKALKHLSHSTTFKCDLRHCSCTTFSCWKHRQNKSEREIFWNTTVDHNFTVWRKQVSVYVFVAQKISSCHIIKTVKLLSLLSSGHKQWPYLMEQEWWVNKCCRIPVLSSIFVPSMQ